MKNFKMKNFKINNLLVLMLAVIFLVLSMCGCAMKTSETGQLSKGTLKEATRDIYAMDTYMSVTAYGYGDSAKEAVDEAIAEIRRLDLLFSAVSENSIVYKLNQNGEAVLEGDSLEIVKKSMDIFEMTGGAFDISIYPVVCEWGFPDRNYKVPTIDGLAEALSKVGSDRIKLNEKNGKITLEEGQQIDLGAIAKGYTSDHIMDIFDTHNVTSGVVYLGGNVECYKMKADGEKWRVGIQDPLNPGDGASYLGVVNVNDEAVVTSGPYERFFVDDIGNFYHHIINPMTGCPSQSGLVSVTIVSPDGTLADALSTAVYVMGKEAAEVLWNEHKKEFDMILMTEDNKLYITEGLADCFEAKYECTVLK